MTKKEKWLEQVEKVEKVLWNLYDNKGEGVYDYLESGG